MGGRFRPPIAPSVHIKTKNRLRRRASKEEKGKKTMAMGNGKIETTYLDPETGVTSAHNPNAIPLAYIDPSGRSRIGYAIANRMYQDEAGQHRVENGSIVSDASGSRTWVMTPQGGVDWTAWQAGQNASAGDAAGYLQKAQAAAKRAAEERTAAEVSALEAQRPEIGRQYDALARANYQGYQQSREGLANSLTSQGLYNSGYSDSAQIAQMTAYRERGNQNEQERLRALAALEQQISAARQAGSANLAELEADYFRMMQEQANADRSDAYQRQRDAVSDAQAARAYEDSRADVAFEQSLKLRNAKSAEEQLAIQNAYAAAEYGDFSLLRALGIDTRAAERAYALETQRLYQSVYGGSRTAGTRQSTDAVQAGLEALKAREAEMEAERLFEIYQKAGNGEQLLIDYLLSASARRMYTDRLSVSGYAYLKQLVAQNYQASMQPNEYLRYEDVAPALEEMLYTTEYGGKNRTTDVAVMEKAVRYLASLPGLSNEEIGRLLTRYQLWDTWEACQKDN